jgi:predicted N-acetyltransferase YhbS
MIKSFTRLLPTLLPLYRSDQEIEAALDVQLRALLLEAFPQEMSSLAHQRYFRECPPHRWIIFDPDKIPIAHAAVHAKVLGSAAGDLPVAGVAEVCVSRSWRGRGLTKILLPAIQKWTEQQGWPFLFLLGDPTIYGSSGYQHAFNPFRYFQPQTQQWVTEPLRYALFKACGKQEWPKGLIDLRGPTF